MTDTYVNMYNDDDTDNNNSDDNYEENNNNQNDNPDDNQEENQEDNQEENQYDDMIDPDNQVQDENYYQAMLDQANIINNHYYCNILKSHFQMADCDIDLNKIKSTLDLIYNHYNVRNKNRPILKNWFQSTEITVTHRNDSNDLSSYIIQLITDQSINLTSSLESICTEQNDKTKINNMGVLIQDWINIMEYVDGGYHLNISNINDFNTLLVWIFIMFVEIKFVPYILRSHLSTHNLFSIEFLQRKVNGINLMTMSVWNKEIRDIIIEHTGKTLYTTLLNEDIQLSNNNSITLIEMAIMVGTFYDMIKFNQLDIDLINYKENNNIMHLLFETINPMICKLRKQHVRYKKLRIYDMPEYNDIPENLKHKFEEIKFQKNDKNMIPLTSLLYGYTYEYYNYCNTNLRSFIDIYNIEDCDKITLNNNIPLELMFIFNTTNFGEKYKNNTNIQKVFNNYFIDYFWSFKKSIYPTYKNIYTYFFLGTSKYSDIIQQYSGNLNINKILEYGKNNNISSLIVGIYINEKINLLESLIPLCSQEKYNTIIKDLINLFDANLNNIGNILIYNFYEFLIGKNHIFNYDIFMKYITIQISSKFSQNFSDTLDKFYNLDEFKSNTSKLITSIIYNQNFTDINENKDFNIKTLIMKYLNEICSDITSDIFIKLCKIPSARKELIYNPNIKTEIKFGSINDGINKILIILDMMDDTYNYVPHDINEYKNIHYKRLNECLQTINIEPDFILFCNTFQINDEYVHEYNIKDKYIDSIYIENNNFENLQLFLNKFKFTSDDYNKFSNKINAIFLNNNMSSILFIEHLISEGLLNCDMTKMFLNRIKYYYMKKANMLINIIQKYKDNDIIHNTVKLLFENELQYNNIQSYLNENKIIDNFISEIDIQNKNNIVNVIKYYFQLNNLDILKLLIIKYGNTFVETKLININDKLGIVYLIHNSIENHIIHNIINLIKSANDIKYENINKFAYICNLYEIKISNELINVFPELIHISQISQNSDDKKLVDDILNKSLENYDIFLKIIKFKTKSETIKKKLLKLTKSNDMSLYIECLIEYKEKLLKNDKKIIIDSLINDDILLKYVVENEKFKNHVFDSDEEISKLVDENDNYIITNLEHNIIKNMLQYYSLEDLKKPNKFGNPKLFAFLLNADLIEDIINKFGLSNLVNIKNKLNQNIYDKMIYNGIFTDIPEEYILNQNNIFNIIKTCDTKYLDKIINNLTPDQFNNFVCISDIDNNNMIYYLIKLHVKLFKELVKNNKIKKDMFCNNNLNETLIMKLIRDSQLYDLDNIIIWITHTFKLDVSDYYVDKNYGSVLSYVMKYNTNLIRTFLTPEILKYCIHTYDKINMICPYSENSYSKDIKMNMLYIATIIDHTILDKILKFNKKISSKLFKEKLSTKDFEHNLLSVALFNNPESVQIILSYNLCDNDYIKQTDDLLNGFESVIDVQPSSWYYLQNGLKIKNYKLKLDTEAHWYGYNYKRNFNDTNIKKITHYILDKQEISNKKETCDICETYKRKIVFTKCRHKVCIVCAIHSDKCGNCRVKLDENDKILI